MYLRSLVKAALKRTQYKLLRIEDENRFQALDAALIGIRRRGYAPSLIIDTGAHLGDFTFAAQRIFPGAKCILVEPQTACLPHLQNFCRQYGHELFTCALGSQRGTLHVSVSSVPSTGVHVEDDPSDGVSVEARTLNDILVNRVGSGSSSLLKMDLQGYELQALYGADDVIKFIDVIIIEASFFTQGTEPLIADLVAHMERRNFVLYDVAAISGRRRDNRARQCDLVFVRKDADLMLDAGWE